MSPLSENAPSTTVDITAELRCPPTIVTSLGDEPDIPGAGELMRRAADEIEILRSVLARVAQPNVIEFERYRVEEDL